MKNSKKRIWLAIALVVASFSVYAHNGATGIVKDRMDSMSEMGDAMKVMADMMKGKRPYEIELVRESADNLAEHAKTLVEFFPDTEDSRMSMESDALPEIWTSWDKFQARSDKLGTAVETLRQAASEDLDKRSFRLVFSKTAKACSSCHDDYRPPEV